MIAEGPLFGIVMGFICGLENLILSNIIWYCELYKYLY